MVETKPEIVKSVKPQTEKTKIAEIFKQDGMIAIEFPNSDDVLQYELYGFLNCYVEILKEQLIDEFGE